MSFILGIRNRAARNLLAQIALVPRRYSRSRIYETAAAELPRPIARAWPSERPAAVQAGGD